MEKETKHDPQATTTFEKAVIGVLCSAGIILGAAFSTALTNENDTMPRQGTPEIIKTFDKITETFGISLD